MIPTSLPHVQDKCFLQDPHESGSSPKYKTCFGFFDSFYIPESEDEPREVRNNVSVESSASASDNRVGAVFQSTMSLTSTDMLYDSFEGENKGSSEIRREGGLLRERMSNSQEAPLLKPLQENPLHQKTAKQFGLPIGPNHPYYVKNEKWCVNVEKGFISKRDQLDCVERMKKSREKLEISDDLNGCTNKEKEHLKKIDEALERIILESEKKIVEHLVIDESIAAIYQTAYQLLRRPVLSFFNYCGSSNAFFNHFEPLYRRELSKVFPDPSQKVTEILLGKMTNGMRNNEIEKTKDILIQEHPRDEDIVHALALKAHTLLKEAREGIDKEALKEVDKFHTLPAIKFCFEQIFNSYPALMINYQQKINDGYCFDENVIDYYTYIYTPSYLSQLVNLFSALEKYRSTKKDSSTLQQLSTSCSEFSKQKKQMQHFEQVVAPLIYFKQCLGNILLWPQEYELAYCERVFINSNLSFLMGISLKDVTGISYEYLTVTPERRKKAESALKKKDVKPEEKREACRTLLHARIPWRALQAIGSHYYKFEDGGHDEVFRNSQLISELWPDMVKEIPNLLECIEELIEFEENCFSFPTAYNHLKKITNQSFESIQLLGYRYEMLRSLKKMHECVAVWSQLPASSAQYGSAKFKYAMLRTIQILGEMSKNLHRTTFREKEDFWQEFEELRDLLSHLDRSSIGKRFKLLMGNSILEDPTSGFTGLFSAIHVDFQLLEEYLGSEIATYNQAKPWEWDKYKKDLKELKREKKKLETKGIENLLIFLNEKISRDRQAALMQSLDEEGASHIRNQTIIIKELFENEEFDPKAYKEQIAQLPLSVSQQKSLEDNIKVIISPKAAKNNFISAKPNLLLKFYNVLNEMNKGFKTSAALELFGKIKDTLPTPEVLKRVKKREEPLFSEFHTEADFKVKILAVSRILAQIKEICTWSKSSSEDMKTAQTCLEQLQESTEEFQKRKRVECQEILKNIEVYSQDAEVKDTSLELVRSMQLPKLTEEDFKLRLKRLGLSYGGIWKLSYDICMNKQNLTLENENVIEKDFFDVQKKKTIVHLDVVLERLRQLENLVFDGSGKLNLPTLAEDKILQLAFQFIVSSFRSNAGGLNIALDSLRHRYPEDKEFKVTQAALEKCVQIGNSILHVHEVTEPGTRTADGQLDYVYMNALALLLNFNSGTLFNGESYEPRFRIYSLNKNLQDLRAILTSSQRQKSLLLHA